MAVQIQLRRGTAAQWTSANPTLASGEVGVETDTNKQKVGDGTTAWNSLAYFNVNGISFGTTGLTPSTSTAGNVTVAGTLVVSNGGTGLSTIPAGNVVIGNGTSALYGIAPGTAGNVLTSIAGVWVSNAAVGGGGGFPGGNPGQIQYNNSGAFGGDANLTFSGSTTTAANLIVSNLTASQAVFSSSTKQLVSNPITGTGSVVMNSSPILTSPTLITPALGTPASGTVTNLTGTASININGTVGATTANTGTFSSTVHKGATSGTVTLTANAISGTQSYTLPPAQPTVNGQALVATTAGVMSWATAGGGSPGGSNTQVQYNNAGAFGGISGFTTDGTRVTASTTIAVGGATPSTSGSGITFPATQSASTDANTLDDYEEGTSTITLTAASGTIAMLGGFDTIRYTKVGRLVTISGRLYVNTVSSPTGALTLNGLPFACGNAGSAESSICFYSTGLLSSATTAIQAIVISAATTISIRKFTAGSAIDTLAADVQAGSQFYINGTYSV